HPCSHYFSFFSHAPAPHRDLHSFPTRRSSDLADQSHRRKAAARPAAAGRRAAEGAIPQRAARQALVQAGGHGFTLGALSRNVVIDRKSTRLNSSHSQISYAVFCLKKKKKKKIN